MHYIRLLRPPKLIRSPHGLRVELVLAVTTDLGDAFLRPEATLNLLVQADVISCSGTVTSCELQPATGRLQWQAGDRLAKPTLDLPASVMEAVATRRKVELCVSPAAPYAADGLPAIRASTSTDGHGLVMPVWVALSGCGDGPSDFCTRRLRLGGASMSGCLELEEELGDSIARHIWDASPVALAAVAGASSEPCVRALSSLLEGPEPISVLELGCGVGILGAGLCALRRRSAASACTVLMTDLDEAEDRARANMGLLRAARPDSSDSLLYESLDWDEGRRGRFGPLVRSRRWDLVMLSDCTYNTDTLPALVGTLSALHQHNATGRRFTSRTWVATKQRHESERAVLGLLADDGWKTVATQTLPLPVLGGEDQAIEMYLFEKD
ncbi:hypothetical protein XA68_13279 [Ophiocordyceps unilateralis]|uniref:Uncharacterized protein n=1 Tax=Ophiocordyceps unilateralis TaxID=268505 RepID=A0A2A9PBH8_OPHUN|nr:hypothetical protein XA68_13279 [Ophiocordyceps unilateralis]